MPQFHQLTMTPETAKPYSGLRLTQSNELQSSKTEKHLRLFAD
jgi:hypothetical protein